MNAKFENASQINGNEHLKAEQVFPNYRSRIAHLLPFDRRFSNRPINEWYLSPAWEHPTDIFDSDFTRSRDLPHFNLSSVPPVSK